MLIAIAIAVILGYLVGSVPFGFLIARANGVDIQQVGSGNIGATNVFRILGKGWGLLTFGLDFCKGLFPVLFIGWLLRGTAASDLTISVAQICAGVAAILGHSFSCFLNFTGGKGVATGAGMMVGLVPWLALLAFLIWILVLALKRMVSLASISAALTIGIGSWLPWFQPRSNAAGSDAGSAPWILSIALTLLAVLVVFRHRGNIRRILAGNENKIGAKARSPTVTPTS